jgi:stage V sporulation protein B
MPIMNVIDLAIVMRRLQGAGFSAAEANNLYGQLTGFAGPMINIPQVLTQAIAMSMVPAAAAAFRQQDQPLLHRNVQLGLRVALIVGLPCGIGLISLAGPIMRMLYPLKPEAAANAASCLSILAFGVIFLAVVQTLTAVLQGIGKQNIPVRNLFIGALVKVVLTYCLTGIPALNVRGAALGTAAAYATAGILDFAAVIKYTGVRFDLRQSLLKPLGAALCMWAWVLLCRAALFPLCALCLGGGSLANAVATVLSIGTAAVVFGLMLLALRAIRSDELENLPKGRKLAALLRRFGR